MPKTKNLSYVLKSAQDARYQVNQTETEINAFVGQIRTYWVAFVAAHKEANQSEINRLLNEIENLIFGALGQ